MSDVMSQPQAAPETPQVSPDVQVSSSFLRVPQRAVDPAKYEQQQPIMVEQGPQVPNVSGTLVPQQQEQVEPQQQEYQVPPPPLEQPMSQEAIALQQMYNQMQQQQSYMQQLQQQNAQMQQALQQYEQMRQQAELMQGVDASAFENFQTVDAGEAQAIANEVLKATSAQLQQMRNEMQQQRQYMNGATQHQHQEYQRQRAQQLNREIMRVHPDFFEIQNTPEYKAFMAQRDGLSSETYDQRAAREYYNGNVAYVIDILNKIKGMRPQPQAVQSVPPVQMASAGMNQVPQAVPQPQFTVEQLRLLRNARAITPDQFKSEMAKIPAEHI